MAFLLTLSVIKRGVFFFFFFFFFVKKELILPLAHILCGKMKCKYSPAFLRSEIEDFVPDAKISE